MAYIIIRGEDNLGPFSLEDVAEFVNSGIVLAREKCVDTSQPSVVSTVGEILRSHGVNAKVKQSGSLFGQLKTIGSELLLPKTVFSSEPWKRDRRLLLLAIVGVSLSVLINISGILPELLVFYIVSLYFAVIWGLFFYYLFCTEQVKLKTTILILFATQIITVLLFDIFEIGGWLGHGFIGCILGIGIPEEFTKLAIILVILSKTKEVMSPATMVYYGLMSGISFGIFEGVQSQTTTNYEILLSDAASSTSYTISFLMNIARLTALPFLHAVWCGISSYYASCAWVFPHYRNVLIALALIIPAVLHGVYDFFAFNGMSLLCVFIVFLSVVLLMVYLANHSKLEQKLR